MGIIRRALVIAAGCLAASISAAQDLATDREIFGRVVFFDFNSPTTSIEILSRDEFDEETVWRVTTASAAELRRLGWLSSSLREGDRVTVTGRQIDETSLELLELIRVDGSQLLPPNADISNRIAPGTYRVANGRGHIDVHIDSFGFSTAVLRFPTIDATLEVPAEGVEFAEVSAALQLEALIGTTELVSTVKSAELLDASRYPQILLNASGVSRLGPGQLSMNLEVELLGRRQVLPVEVEIKRVGRHPLTNQLTLGVSGRAELSRSNWTLASGPNGVGDRVEIYFDLELEQAEPAASNP